MSAAGVRHYVEDQRTVKVMLQRYSISIIIVLLLLYTQYPVIWIEIFNIDFNFDLWCSDLSQMPPDYKPIM